jgi:hypothetical protein
MFVITIHLPTKEKNKFQPLNSSPTAICILPHPFIYLSIYLFYKYNSRISDLYPTITSVRTM